MATKKTAHKRATTRKSVTKRATQKVAIEAPEPKHHFSISNSANILLSKLPPDLREKIFDQVKIHGPTFALATVQNFERKATNRKLKLALKGLSAILGAMIVQKHST